MPVRRCRLWRVLTTTILLAVANPVRATWMLSELAATDCPMSYPHGRPIALRYSMRDILKSFHRI